jgi:CRP/FNR family transcriptional regulator, cyclic AMP receptor protein
MGTDMAVDHVVEILERVRLFQGLPRSDLEQIAGIMKPRTLAPGEFLFRESDPGDRFYVVFDGAVEILRERPLGDHERQSVRRAGEAFGELALLSDAPRTESVRGLEDTRLLSVTRTDFEALLGGDSLAVRVIRGLAWSLRQQESEGDDALARFGQAVLRGLEPRRIPRTDGFQVAGARTRDDGSVLRSVWDAVPLGDGRVVLALLDVKGQGLPPAYLIGITRALLHEVAREEPFERLLGRLNAAIFHNLFDGVDACVEAALVEVSHGGLRWSRAGDQAGMVIRADGTVEAVETQGPPLGILPAFDYGARAVDLGDTDTFLALTETPERLVRGAVDLIRSRADGEPVELGRLLRAALRQVHSPGTETDVAFLMVRKA